MVEQAMTPNPPVVSEAVAKYLFENQPKTSRFAACYGGWSGIGGSVKQAWRDYANAALAMHSAAIPSLGEGVDRIMADWIAGDMDAGGTIHRLEQCARKAADLLSRLGLEG